MDMTDFALMNRIDSLNTIWLKAVIDERGWPRRSEVGTEGAHAAWLLALHANRDPEFQQHVLPLMEAAVEDGEAAANDFAYLVDRVRLGKERNSAIWDGGSAVGGRRAYPSRD